jgi:hypothetical protein
MIYYFHGPAVRSGTILPRYRDFAIALGRTPLGEWSDRRRDLYLATHNTHKRQTSTPTLQWYSNPQFEQANGSDPRRRPHGPWYRQGMVYSILSTRINHVNSCGVMSILLISCVDTTFITQSEVRNLTVCIWNTVTYLNTYINCLTTQGSYRTKGWPSLCQTVVSSSKNSFLPRISYSPPFLRTCLRVSL